MAQRALAALLLWLCGCCSEQSYTVNPHRNMSLKCWEIILAKASSRLHSAHTYVNWTFFPPRVRVQFPNTSLYYAGQWISVIQVKLAVANWQGELPITAPRYNTGLQWGAANVRQAPPSQFLHLRGFDLTPSAPLTLKTFMYHISRGKGRRREKAILAYSKRHTRRLCLSTTEYLSQAGGKSKPLCAFTTKNVLLFKMETSKHSGGKQQRQAGISDLVTRVDQRWADV